MIAVNIVRKGGTNNAFLFEIRGPFLQGLNLNFKIPVPERNITSVSSVYVPQIRVTSSDMVRNSGGSRISQVGATTA